MNSDHFFKIGITAIILFGFWMIGYSIYNEYKHPCIRTQNVQSTCGGGMYCMMMDPNNSGMCLVWSTYPTYACTITECVERK